MVKTTSKKTQAKKKAAPKVAKAPKVKAPAKKRITKKKVFTKAAEDKLFGLLDGKTIGHFVDLAHTLEDMHEEVFSHHVRDDKNDFANWIRDVFDEPELAKKVASKKNKKDIQITIYKYVITKHLH